MDQYDYELEELAKKDKKAAYRKWVIRWLWISTSICAVLLISFVFICNRLLIHFESAAMSSSIGTYQSGRLINGKRLPERGVNFRSYSRLGSALGRTCVHSLVRSSMLLSYSYLQQRFPYRRFVYGETGWCKGGKFAPHKTHQNGLSVDFMVPIINPKGLAIPFPSHFFNLFGYRIEFDEKGSLLGAHIDYEAMAWHLYELQRASKRHNLAIQKVIFAPELQTHLFATDIGKKLKKSMRFSRRKAWIRHDEHYHVNFMIR